MTDTYLEQKRQVFAAWDDERQAQIKAHEAALAAIDARYESQGWDSSDARWNDEYNIDDGFERCGKSGMVLFEGDQVLTDPDTDKTYLRAALGLPPLPSDDAEDESSGLAEDAA